MTQIIDTRSDTVTRPTAAMLEAMMSAAVGDDVYGEDPTVNALQEKAADLFGTQAALFCPSGTMTNQIGIRLHTRPGDEVICDELSHVYLYEVGGIAANSGASVRLLKGDRGRFTAEQVKAQINSRNDVHGAWSRLVVIENTVNKGGGACWDLAEVERIRSLCNEQELALHLDGARVFNAIVAGKQSPRDYGRLFDTISICLSKGLGTPAGSLLLGTREAMAKARRHRKMMGGGMRQAGYLAAAGLFALEHNVNRLQDDHRRAQTLGRELQSLAFVANVLPVETNIVIFNLQQGLSTDEFLRTLHSHGIKAGTMGGATIRFVLHLDIDDDQLSVLVEKLRGLQVPSDCQ